MTPVLILISLLTVLLLCVRWYESRLIYPRSHTFRTSPEDTDLEVEELSFCAEDGTALSGWWFPRENAKGAILVCHGNAGNVSDRLWIAEDLRDLPVHILVFDYRGYGRSRGIPSEKGTGLDVCAAYECLRMKAGWGDMPRPPVLLYGRSLGGAVALQAIEAGLSFRGLILEGTFTSIAEIAETSYAWLLPSLTLRHPYRSDERIAHARLPLLMAHSPEDRRIPFSMAERLYAKAPQPWGFCRLVGDHVSSGWQTSPEYAQVFREFVAHCLREPDW